MDARTPPTDPAAAFGQLAPYRAQLVLLKRSVRPYSLEWDALDDAIRALDRAAAKLTGRQWFFAAARGVPVIGQVSGGGVVRLYGSRPTEGGHADARETRGPRRA